jgi:RNA polymerase sigma-70 factor (ECF subfamily)
MQDRQIIEGLRNNDSHVIGQFYNQNRKVFINYFRTTYGKTDDDYLKELYQDSCVSVWENAKMGKLNKMTSTLTTYLFAVGKYKMMAHDRKYKEMTTELDLQRLNLVDSDAEEMEEKEEKERKIDEIVGKMTYPCSDILRMHYWEKLSGEEIAVQMKYASADAVKSQKYKCMQKLKQAVMAVF